MRSGFGLKELEKKRYDYGFHISLPYIQLFKESALLLGLVIKE